MGGTWSSPAYFNNLIYYLGNGDVLKAFAIANAQIANAPVSRSSTSFGFPGATPSSALVLVDRLGELADLSDSTAELRFSMLSAQDPLAAGRSS